MKDTLRGLVLMGFLLAGGVASFAQPAAANGPTLVVEWRTDSVERILLRPEEILADPESFWRTDDAFQLAARWHRNNGVPVEMERFLEDLTRASEVPPERREEEPSLVLARSIRDGSDRFAEVAIPLVLSFLPSNDLQMETVIHLTGFSRAYAFMTDTQIVAAVTSPKLGGTTDSVLNILLHEVYHIGYGINRLLRSEEPLEDSRAYAVLDVLHNEGLATYVAWTARSEYPFDELGDYRMLADEETVEGKIRMVNEIFSQIDSLSPDEFSKLSWEEGVANRAYYIAGAHMSRLIDTRLGRGALLETIEKGPRSFVALYNAVADEDLKIREFAAPVGTSIHTRLYRHLQGNPDSDLSGFADELMQLRAQENPSLNPGLNKLAYRLCYTGRPAAAVRVAERAVALFPEDANLHDTLAEMYMRNGQKDEAILHYGRSLELDPTNTNAERYLEALTGKGLRSPAG